ncbi:uncharacterized [Tachysurus ichikawai]
MFCHKSLTPLAFYITARLGCCPRAPLHRSRSARAAMVATRALITRSNLHRELLPFPLTLIFAFHYAPYSGVQLPLCTALSGAGGGWKHWLSKLVFKWNFAGLRALHYSWPVCEKRSAAPLRSSLRSPLLCRTGGKLGRMTAWHVDST